jgi:hypothetical protein
VLHSVGWRQRVRGHGVWCRYDFTTCVTGTKVQILTLSTRAHVQQAFRCRYYFTTCVTGTKVQILTLRTRAHVQQAFRWSGASWRISAAAVCVSRGQGRAAAFLFYSWFFFFYTCCCAAGVCVTGKGELLLLRSTIAGVVA